MAHLANSAAQKVPQQVPTISSGIAATVAMDHGMAKSTHIAPTVMCDAVANVRSEKIDISA